MTPLFLKRGKQYANDHNKAQIKADIELALKYDMNIVWHFDEHLSGPLKKLLNEAFEASGGRITFTTGMNKTF